MTIFRDKNNCLQILATQMNAFEPNIAAVFIDVQKREAKQSGKPGATSPKIIESGTS